MSRVCFPRVTRQPELPGGEATGRMTRAAQGSEGQSWSLPACGERELPHAKGGVLAAGRAPLKEDTESESVMDDR